MDYHEVKYFDPIPGSGDGSEYLDRASGVIISVPGRMLATFSPAGSGCSCCVVISIGESKRDPPTAQPLGEIGGGVPDGAHLRDPAPLP